MKLKAVDPIVKPASDQIVYDDYWMVNMQVNAQNPNGRVSINGRLVPSRDVVVDGVTTKELDRGNGIQLNIPDVFARIDADPTGPLAQAFGAIMAALIAEMPELTTE